MLKKALREARVGSTCFLVGATNLPCLAGEERPQAVERLPALPGQVQQFEVRQRLSQVSFGFFPLLLFQVHTPARSQRDGQVFARSRLLRQRNGSFTPAPLRARTL